MHSPSVQRIGREDAGESFEIVEGDASCGVLFLADHASCAMPAEFDNLGLPPSQLRRHIAYDIGAATVTRTLAAAFDAPAVLSCFSRLLIDPNRGDDDPTLVMRLSDGAVVPGNATIDSVGIRARMERFSLPYHQAIARTLDRMTATGAIPAVVSFHSFTPRMQGVERPWHAGVLWDSDPRLPLAALDALRADPSLVVGDNEPYDGCLAGDTMGRHCIPRGIAHVLIEVRQDLIDTEHEACSWGEKLARVLAPALARAEMHEIRHYGSRAD